MQSRAWGEGSSCEQVSRAAVRLAHRGSCTGGLTVLLGGVGVEATDSRSLMSGRNWVKGRAGRKPCRGGGGKAGRRARTSGFYSVTVNRGVIGVWESCSG